MPIITRYPPAASAIMARLAFQTGFNVRIILDVDGTLTFDDPALDYPSRRPRLDVIERINHLHRCGIPVIVYSARNMRTYAANTGHINRHTIAPLVEWLDRHGVLYDELYVGKPWCGPDGFYVHQQSIRPSQLTGFSAEELEQLVRSGHPEAEQS